MFSFFFIEEYMFILAESTGILLDPMCRMAFQKGGSTLQVGSERSLLIKLQFPTGSLAVGPFYFPTGAAAMRDSQVVNVLSLISLAKSWKISMYFGGDWNGHIGNDHGGDDIHIQRIRLRSLFCKRRFISGRPFSFTGQERNVETQWELVRERCDLDGYESSPNSLPNAVTPRSQNMW